MNKTKVPLQEKGSTNGGFYTSMLVYSRVIYVYIYMYIYIIYIYIICILKLSNYSVVIPGTYINWRYLPDVRPMEGQLLGNITTIYMAQNMVQYLHFKVLNFPLT